MVALLISHISVMKGFSVFLVNVQNEMKEKLERRVSICISHRRMIS